MLPPQLLCTYQLADRIASFSAESLLLSSLLIKLQWRVTAKHLPMAIPLHFPSYRQY